MASKNSTAAPSTADAAANGFSAKPQPESVPEQPDLSATITTLKAALDQASQKEQQLETTIAELQNKVMLQITTIQDLQTQVQQAQQWQASLDKAEAAARQLAVLNETLIAENTALKAAQPATQPPAVEPTSSLATRNKPHSNLIHPVFPNGKPPSGIADQEIGWFD